MIKKHFKKLLKIVGNSSIARKGLCLILIVVVRFVHFTGRFKYIGTENIEPFWQEKKPVIMATWHSRIMLVTYFWRTKNLINALVSPHRDGLILSSIFRNFGVKVINGSSFKNPARAAVALKKMLDQNESIAITPDGPRGPRMKLGSSLIYFAKISGAPVIPIIYSTNRCIILNSWDRFMLVLPFAKGVFFYGKPFFVPKDSDETTMENLRIKLEKELIDLQNKADEMMNLKPIN
ncbi:MAG: lysophospholipid acyltransferase family protein [Alphaproteobacteria bacterium]